MKTFTNYLAANPSVSGQHLSGLLQAANVSWKSYQEGIHHLDSAGTNINVGGSGMTSTVAPSSTWIMASQAYQDHRAIVIWTDETEGTNQNDFTTR